MDPDISQLAAQLATFLAPFLPYLVKGGKLAAKKAFEKAGEIFVEEAWERAEKLWDKLKPKVDKKRPAKEAVKDVINMPKDEDSLVVLRQQIKKILLEDPKLAQEMHIIIGQVGSLYYTQASHGSVAAGQSIEKSLIALNGSQIIQNYFQHNPHADKEDLQQQVIGYLHWVEEYFRFIELRGIEQGESPVIRLELNKVYVPLQAVFQAETEESQQKYSRANPKQKQLETQLEKQSNQVALNQILPLGNRLIITGGPGCGKTTVLQHIAWSLANSWLYNSHLATENLGIKSPYPLPIYVPLNLYAVHLRSCKDSPAKHKTLAHFISEYLIQNQTNLDIDADFFAFLLREEHNVILLLDGLDEVPTEDERVIIREAIEKLVVGKENLRAVVTSRTAAYYGEAIFGRGFRHVRVLPLEKEHIQSLVRQAYTCRFPNSIGQAQREAQSLLDGIQRLEEERKRILGEDVEPLVDSPLMVRMLLIVAANERVLPNQRADLYQKTVDAMLRSENVLDKRVAIEISQRVGGGIAIHREMLQYLAFNMHQRGEQGKDIDEETLKEILKNTPHAAYSNDLIELTRQRGTVLDFRGGYYRFFHLSFQEFLAARYLADNLRDIEKIAQFLESGPITDSWWREAVLLLCGYLDMNATSQAGALLKRLAGLDEKTTAREQEVDLRLACAEVAGAAILECQYQPIELARKITDQLVRLIEKQASSSPQLRASAGDTLARLGDPRPGISPLLKGEEPRMRDMNLLFCEIPAGPFLMGSRKREKDSYEQEQPQFEYPKIIRNYYLSRYPVTNAQFDAFVEDPAGYASEQWWTEAGLDWRNEKKNQDRPPMLGGAFGLSNHPVINVTWYEAYAFTRWLDNQLKSQDLKLQVWRGNNIETISLEPSQWEARLPTEAEWEKAARGEDGRRFPWGNEITPNHANYDESRIGSTSAVGCFPLGASPYGLLDMSGNVWEWCLTQWTDNYEEYLKKEQKLNDPQGNSARVLRGGAFLDNDRDARCAYRNGLNPDNGWLRFGFRVVVVSSPVSLVPHPGS